MEFLSLPYGDGFTMVGGTNFDSLVQFTGKQYNQENNLYNFNARYYGDWVGRFMSPDFSDGPDTVPYAEFENPQTLNLYNYGRSNPLTDSDPDGHDVSICSTYGAGGTDCKIIPNNQYDAAQKAGNGGLNVPTLDQVGSSKDGNGNFIPVAITGANGQVGTAKYVPDNVATDYYVNSPGYNVIATASRGVTQVTAVAAAVYGAAGGAAVFTGGGSALTTLGIPTGLRGGAAIGGYVLSQHAADQAQKFGVSVSEIEEAVSGVAKGNPNNPWDSVQRFYTATCEVRVNKITGTIVTVINKIKR
jgi:RHS repeat-associated protein